MFERFPCWKDSHVGKIPILERFPCWKDINVGKISMLERFQFWKDSNVIPLDLSHFSTQDVKKNPFSELGWFGIILNFL